MALIVTVSSEQRPAEYVLARYRIERANYDKPLEAGMPCEYTVTRMQGMITKTFVHPYGGKTESLVKHALSKIEDALIGIEINGGEKP